MSINIDTSNPQIILTFSDCRLDSKLLVCSSMPYYRTCSTRYEPYVMSSTVYLHECRHSTIVVAST